MYSTSITSLAHETYKQNIYWLRHCDNDNNLVITILLVKKIHGQIFFLNILFKNRLQKPVVCVNRRDNY